MNTKLFASALLFSSSILMASECTLTKVGDIDIAWTAFKTPAKAGVKGSFDQVVYQGGEKASSLEKLLVGSKVTIDTAKVNSGNPGRDAKLVASFFNVMTEGGITAEIVKVDKKMLTIAVMMNGVTKEVPMHYTEGSDTLSANGVIDLGDFSALGALVSINKACSELHQGKTWQDVEIGFSFDLTKQCK